VFNELFTINKKQEFPLYNIIFFTKDEIHFISVDTFTEKIDI